MKGLRNILLIGVFIFMVFLLPTPAYAEKTFNGVTILNQSGKADGKICVQGTSKTDNIKILVVKDKSKDWYDVNVVNNKFSQDIWLVMGKGNYTVSIMINNGGNKYKYGPQINVANQVDVNEYLVPAKNIESNNNEIIEIANTITKDKTTDIEKAKAINEWVSKNVKYDYEKYNKQINKNTELNYGALEALKNNKGICYDFAALTAALGRASGLQVKVISGYIYADSQRRAHNWNEIYVSELNKWIKVDTSYGAITNLDTFDNDVIFKEYFDI